MFPPLFITDKVDLTPDILPAGCPIRRIRGVDEIPADDRNVVAVLTPPEAESVLADAAGYPVVLWREGFSLAPALLGHPRVVGVLDARCSRETVQATLKAAFRLLAVESSEDAARMLEDVLEIGRALASEKNLDTLLSLILTHARSLTGADGSSIYTRDRDGVLYFRLWQNASTTATANAQKTLVGEYSIAGYVARSGETVLLDDAYAIPESAPYRFNPASDRAIGYHTKSLLTLPLTNKGGEVVGVLQLINRKNRPDVLLRTPDDIATHVRSFDARSRQLAQALAGQAGVAIENSMLYADIERLFEGFIKASVQAIEARDPTTAGHSFRVADFCERLAMAVDRADRRSLRDIRFSREQLRELRYAALLHDIGKIGVREQVLVKAKKLQPPQLALLQQRFRYARVSLERRLYQKLLALHDQRELDPAALAGRRRDIEQAFARDLAKLDEYLRVVLHANEPTVLPGEIAAGLDDILSFRFPSEHDEELLLHDFEFSDLSIVQGSLNDEERAQIESHVSHTYTILSLIPWTRDLARLPEIAYGHHEKLDGTGYPRRLAAKDIPVPTRIMTIADIYDALTAPDRPYKRHLSAPEALDILQAEAKAGKVDTDLFETFVESRAWQPAH